MRLSFPVFGLILFDFAASQVHGQTGSPPINPKLGRQSVESASLNTSRNAMPPDASASAAVPAAPDTTPQNGIPICGIIHLVRCIQDLGEDEKGIFTGPLRVQPKDAYWLAPLGAATGLAFAYDADAAQAAGVDASRANTANKISDFGSSGQPARKAQGFASLDWRKRIQAGGNWKAGRRSDHRLRVRDFGYEARHQSPASRPRQWTGRFLGIRHRALAV
jgi:hypothetical protein